eukprot:622615_1
MALFSVEYLMICRLFSCKVFNTTSCDLVYVFSILSLVIELTRITPAMKQFNYYSLDDSDPQHHIDNALYWKHKLFDSFIDLIIYLRVVQSILRAVLYYIYGKEYRQTHGKYEKDGYQQTAVDDDADHSLSSSISNTSPDREPEPVQPTIMDDADNTAPLPARRVSIDLLSDNEDLDDITPTPKQDNLAKRFKLKLNLQPLSPAHNHLITPFRRADSQDEMDSADNSPMDRHHKSKGINVNNMLSPPQIEIDPSDVDTQSIERIELHTFQPIDYKHTDMEHQLDEVNEEHVKQGGEVLQRESSHLMVESHSSGDNWGIFPMFASKLGVIGDLCVALISLLDHPYLLMVRICIFAAYFIILMYVSAHHFVQFIRSFLDSNKCVLAEDSSNKCDDLIEKGDSKRDEAVPILNKHIRSIVLNPAINNKSAMNEATTVIFNPWTEAAAAAAADESSNFKDVEFRTGQDEIKKIVRLMLTTHVGYESRCKLENILSILQDIDAMDKGNIEEKIELDDELGMEEKRWLNQQLLSKHENVSTPHFDFNVNATPLTVTAAAAADPPTQITPMTSHDTATNCSNAVDVVAIIEDHIAQQKMHLLGETLRVLSSDLDALTAQIMRLDGSADTIELDRLTATHPLLHASVCIFFKYDFGDELHIDFSRFYHFISYIESCYSCDNPYHNRMHATEVMLATMIFVECLDPTVRAMMTTQQIFCAFIAAIIHDVDHPGNNNAFEINSESDLSVLYSDESVLEFHHLHVAFSALKREANHFTRGWDKARWKEFRKQCIYSVLATDLSKHFGTIAHIKQLKIIKESDLEYVFKSIIKMSDLSHVTKPLRQHRVWTKKITQEFHRQGDKEASHGMDVSPLCNKQNTKIAKGQVGFIKHIVSPLYGTSQRFFEKGSTFDEDIMRQLNANWKYWENEAKKQETPKQATPKKRRRFVSRRHKLQQNRRPQSATFASRSSCCSQRIAILTNLENTPPPILPSSVRTAIQSNRSTNSSDTGKGAAAAKEITFKFESYSAIKGKKRTRSSSNPAKLTLPKPYLMSAYTDALELALPNTTSSTNKLTELITPRSILRLTSPPASAKYRSLTPQFASTTKVLMRNKNLVRTKSNEAPPAPTGSAMHMISPKQFTSPYSISHEVQTQQHHAITIHEEKSSSCSEHQQHFKFEGAIEQRIQL